MSENQRITKGVIAVAGFGTRFLPATKTLPKEMFPIVDQPIIHYVVDEMVQSGLTDIILVTSLEKKTLEDYFDSDPMLVSKLRRANKIKLLEEIEKISQMANFTYVRQKGHYGNGTPVLNVKHLVGNEPFVFAYGDDLVKSKVPFTKQLIENYERNQAVVMGCQVVRQEEVSLYTGIKLRQDSPIMEVEHIVEKPSPEEAPSRLSNFGRFILVPEICNILGEIPPGKGGELWLTDAIEEYIRRGNRVVAQPVQDGRWYTTGDPLRFLEVTFEYALAREDIGFEVREMLKRFL